MTTMPNFIQGPTETSCQLCPAGTYSKFGNCIHCSAGEFSAAGASFCVPCPAGTTTTPNATQGPTNTSCNLCLAGFKLQGSSCIACDPGTYLPTISVASSCYACPQNSMSVASGDASFSVAGAFRCSCPQGFFAEVNNSLSAGGLSCNECRLRWACTGGDGRGPTCNIAGGYTGVQCDSCLPGFYKSDMLGCVACPTKASTATISVITIFFVWILCAAYRLRGRLQILVMGGEIRD